MRNSLSAALSLGISILNLFESTSKLRATASIPAFCWTSCGHSDLLRAIKSGQYAASPI